MAFVTQDVAHIELRNKVTLFQKEKWNHRDENRILNTKVLMTVHIYTSETTRTKWHDMPALKMHTRIPICKFGLQKCSYENQLKGQFHFDS